MLLSQILVQTFYQLRILRVLLLLFPLHNHAPDLKISCSDCAVHLPFGKFPSLREQVCYLLVKIHIVTLRCEGQFTIVHHSTLLIVFGLAVVSCSSFAS